MELSWLLLESGLQIINQMVNHNYLIRLKHNHKKTYQMQKNSSINKSSMNYPNTRPHYRLSSIKQLSPQLYTTLRLCLYIAIIWGCEITSALISQKIYKTPYTKNGDPSVQTYFSNPFALPLFTTLFGYFYGFYKYEISLIRSEQTHYNPQVPIKLFLIISFLDSGIHVCNSWGVILTSYTTYNLINCCCLLSVVVVAVLCGNYRYIIFGQEQQVTQPQGSKIKPKQIIIAFVVVMGIFLFNFYSQSKSDSINKPLKIWSSLLFFNVLLMEGLRPQFFMKVRVNYHPKPSFVFYEVNKYSLLFLLAYSIISGYFFSMVSFIWNYDQLALDLLLHCILGTVGSIFVYRIIAVHKQNVVPFIGSIRRIFTSVINILYFHHHVTPMQIVGILIVGVGVILQLAYTYVQMNKSKEESKAIDPRFQHLEEQDEGI